MPIRLRVPPLPPDAVGPAAGRVVKVQDPDSNGVQRLLDIVLPGDAVPGAEVQIRGLPPLDPEDKFHDAIRHGRTDEVTSLLGRGFTAELCDAKGFPPLSNACYFGWVACAQLLMDARARVDSKDGHSGTALHAACNSGHDACARLLIASGANIHKMLLDCLLLLSPLSLPKRDLS